MNPYQPGEDNQDPYMVGYKAGAASRDAEIAELVAALQMAFDYAIRGKTFPANAQTTALLNAIEIELAKVRKP